MNAYSSDFHNSDRSPAGDPLIAGRAAPYCDLVRTMNDQWGVLHDAASAVAALAGVPPSAPSLHYCGIHAVSANIPGWKLELASNAVTDIAAMMQPGLAALLAVHARGQDATPAALALWAEFEHARDAFLALGFAPGYEPALETETTEPVRT